MRSKMRLLTAVTALVLGAGVGEAQDAPLVSGQLLIQGNRLTIYSDELTTDADQTINVGEQARVRTCFGGPSVPCGSVQPGDPRIAGLAVEAELSGPELPQALNLETVPGGAFVLPGFQQEGDYRLENIRLVNQASGQVLGDAEPSVAVAHVRRIVLASATVRALSLEELRDRGITITEKNFQAFNFAVGFALADEIVQIEFPVVYSGHGVLNPVLKPSVKLDGLPESVVGIVKRWKPPDIVPFRLEKVPGREILDRGFEGDEELSFPLFGAIVIPGTVTFLNQFFEAKLIVANGADPGSGVTLENLHGAVRLPTGNVLRLAQTDPPVAPGQEVPVVKPGGGRVLGPGEQGTAAWTVEGLLPGTHTLQMDITGDLVRPGRDPFPVQSRAQAAVEVVDARFNLTFSHPDVVREGIEYTLFVTVSNMSQATQNLITVEIRDENVTGAHKADPTDDFRRHIETLDPGQSVTVEYELIADLNGKVIATTFQADSTVATGIIRLRTGVGPLGIPLSPATLLMPRFTEQLDPPNSATGELVKSHVRLLGLGYSLAVAPSGQIPPGVPRVVKSDVERRAVDLAEAGQRIFLQERMLETLEVLALDWLGNREHLDEFDELRRRVVQGQRAASQVAAQIRLEQAERGLGALDLFDHFGETASYARPWLAATLVPGAATAELELEVQRMTARGPGVLAGLSDDEDGAVRTLPWGEIYAVHKSPSGGPLTPFALVGHVEPDEVFQVVVKNPTAEPASGRLVLMVPDGESGDYRRLDFGAVTVPAAGALAVDAGPSTPDPSSGGFDLYHLASGAPAGAASLSMVPLPPFRVIGARQHFRIAEVGPDALGNWIRPNRYGSGLTYLFNRPPDKEAAENPANWALLSTFEGLDAVDEPASGVALKTGEAAFRQENSERVVNVRFSGSIAALIRADGSGPLVTHEQQLDTTVIVDERGNPLDPDVPAPILETVPLHVGGLVDGVVRHGTGNPAPGTKVELIRPRKVQTLTGIDIKLDLAATTTTDDNGRFFFEFVEQPAFWDGQILPGFTLRATVPEGDDPELEPAQVQEVSSVIRRQNRMAHVNVQLLGRGTVTGRLVYLDDQQPVPEGKVTGASTLFREIKTVEVEADGSFRIPSLPVGPITLTGRDKDGRSVYATVGINDPGATVDVHLEIQRFAAPEGMGTVTGRVLRRLGEETAPAAGARVACYANGQIIAEKTSLDDGSFVFFDVPEGRVSLQAADWRVSRTAVFTDFLLADGETVDVDLTLPESDARTVVGKVLFDDPVTGTLVPVEGAVAFIKGPGNYAYTDENGDYRIEGVPVQGLTDFSYQVTVIDNNLHAEERVTLPPVLDVSPDVITAETIVLSGVWEGGVDGVVLDPLGRPLGGVELILFPFEEKVSNPDGSFSFDNIPVGDYEVVAHIGDGLQPGRVGYIGETAVRVIYGGHRPFITIRLRGSGVVNVKTRTATSVGILTPIYYKPTYYSLTAKDIVLKGSYFETSTTELGDFQVVLPVGKFELVAYNPFHGIKKISDKIEYPGQVLNLDILFEDAGTVKGQVVDVDGITPVPDVEVTLYTKTLKPQNQRTDAQGNFQFELVPKGGVAVTAQGLVGTVERVGRTVSSVTLGGQVVELTVEMKAQGSIRGQVLENFNGELRPIVNAHYFVQENSYPFRRLPEDGTFFIADSQGRYQVSHVYAGRVNVVARDPLQVTRTGSAFTTITADWQVAQVPDIVMRTSVGSLFVTVRDPETGGPVADAQVRLSNGEVNSTDSQGTALYEALPLGTYSVYAFNAATGQSGRVNGVKLSSPGQRASFTVFLDQRGEVLGTLFDDQAFTVPIAGGTVQLSGSTAGGRLTALATTSGQPGNVGRFAFLGIPEGTFNLTAAVNDSPRRASTQVSLTETAPVADVNLALERVGDVHVRLYEKLTAGTSAVDLESGLFSVHLSQGGAYDFTLLHPLPASDVFFFPDVLLERRATVEGQELGGEQRFSSASLADLEDNLHNSIPGSGSFADPYQLTLRPKGTVVVTVRRQNASPAVGVNVKLFGAGSATDDAGTAVFYAVRAGGVWVSAVDVATGQSGAASGTLTFDDQVLALEITLSPAVSAHGVVYQPVPDDRLVDASQLVPMEGAIVELRDAKNQTQVTLTAADGSYSFDALPTGGYVLKAQDNNGDELAQASGSLVGPDGNDNELPPLVLDASPPRILTMVPPPGIDGVSRLAPVEIVFSEPLAAAVLPVGAGSSSYFELRSASGALATGVWNSFLDPMGQQVVRFEPSAPYDNLTVYSLTIKGGSNGVRDRIGRPVTASGNVGSNFTTSDSIGPAVIGTVPSLDVPVDPQASIRVDFNEAVVATTEQLDGDFTGDAAELYGEGLDAQGDPQWVRLPVVLFLTRSGYSLQVETFQGIAIEGDTLRRRLMISGLEDVFGNPMPAYEKVYRLFDSNPPVLEALPLPANAPDGDLVQGVTYVLTPVISNVDDVSEENPGGDLDRVEYFFADPEDPVNPQIPSYSAVDYPFSYSFIGAYSGNGVDPRPFPVWARAVDTSTNESAVVMLEMQVLPNAPPSVGTVSALALSPVTGVFYAGSAIQAVVAGLDDPDGSQLTLSVELRRDGDPFPVAAPPGRLVTRPAEGWAALEPQTFDFEIPIDLPEATPLYYFARVIDSQGARDEVESERFPVADDAAAPAVDSLAARDDAAVERLVFFIGERITVEFRARDLETAVQSVEVVFDRDDVLPSPVAALQVGTSDLYRTAPIAVPADVFTETVPVTISARAFDYGGNVGERTLAIDLSPEADPNAPQVEWLTPWQDAPWPADYASVFTPQLGTPFLLRALAADTSLDDDGNEVPGQIVTVKFRGPVVDEAGEVGLAPEWIDAALVAGSEAPGEGVYELLWYMPNRFAAGTELPFAVRAVDSGGSATVRTLRMIATASRKVYEGVQTAVAPEDPMLQPEIAAEGIPAGDPEGPVFVLDGSLLSIRPQPDGSVRSLPAMYLYAGGETDPEGNMVTEATVLTAPEITSYSSAVLYNPLELEIAGVFAVGAFARADMTAKGLLGNTTENLVALPGETAAQVFAGGSHGGRGWFGSSSGGWNRPAEELRQPGSVYDSLREPRLPGSGGRSTSSPGGAGGGVIRILAPVGTVRLVGDLVADGAAGASGGGGAGGTIRVAAGRLEGRGRLTAAGGPGQSPNRDGGGGGGRISISYGELAPEVDLVTQTDVSGGHNHRTDPAFSQRLGGAGTLYLEAIDPATGETVSDGAVAVANKSGLPAAFTPLPALGDGPVADVVPEEGKVVLGVERVTGEVVGERLVLELETGEALGIFPITGQTRVFDATAGSFRVELAVEAGLAALQDVESQVLAGAPVLFHGRARFDTLAASGAARVVAGDDLVLVAGGAAPALNDRSRLLLDGEARVLLRGEAPETVFVATPAGGSDVRLGSSLELSWTVTDPIGLAAVATTWQVDGTTSGETFGDQRLEASSGSDPIVLTVPFTQAPGPVSYTVDATDTFGRASSTALTWNVLANALPTGSVAMAGGVPAAIKAGYTGTVVVHAEDLEGLATVTLSAAGPVLQPTQSSPAAGTVADLLFDLTVPADAAGDVPLTVEALVADASGGSVTTAPLVITVVPNEAPTGSVALAPGAAAEIKPGTSTTVIVHAEDPDGLFSVELRAAGAVEPATQVAAVSNPVEDVTFTISAPLDSTPGPVVLTAVIADRFQATTETAALELATVPNALPIGTLALGGGTAPAVFPGATATVSVHAEDEEGLAEVALRLVGPAGPEVQRQVVSGLVADVDFQVEVERTALATDSVVFTGEILDAFGNPPTVTEDLTLGILADTAPPVVTVTGVEPLYSAGQTLRAVIATSDEVGASRVDVTFDGATQTINDPEPVFEHVVPIPRDIAAVRTTAFEVTATDFHGNTSAPVSIPVELQPDRPPLMTVDVLSATQLLPGSNLEVSVAATDDLGLAAMTFTVSGAASDETVRELGGLAATQVYRAGVPTSLTGGEQIFLTVTTADTLGQTVSQTVTFTALADGEPPSVAIELIPQAAGDVYTAGDVVTVVATAEDNVAVSSVTLTVDGASVTGPSPQVYTWTVPAVGTNTPVAIDAEATDPSANVGTASRAVTAAPLLNGGVPAVRFDCPTTGAYLPSGYEVALSVTATDDLGVAAVEFYRDDETVPFATVAPDAGTVTPFVATAAAVLPLTTGEQVVRFRAVASDASTNAGEQEIAVHVVATADLDPAGANDWAALESAYAVLRGGTLTLTEPHALGGLIVLPGASITHASSAAGAEQAVDLTVAGAVYVACGGAIDATGSGYGSDETYPGEVAPGNESGGSHIGHGGLRFAPLASTFGSVYRPRENGGGAQSSCCGGRGGGVVRLTAGAVVVDGSVAANGAVGSGSFGRAGGGGSVWITAGGVLGGAGVIEASGGSAPRGSGGGGAVALEYGAAAGGIVERTRALGGATGVHGGAGSVYLRGPGAVYGDLVIDNAQIVGEPTRLPSLGVGVAQAGSGGTLLVTDRTEPIPAWFVGHWVEIYDPAGEFESAGRIVEIAGTSAVLEAEPGGAAIAVDPGDYWQGVYLFDNATIRGTIDFVSDDPLRVVDTYEIAGEVELSEITAGNLRVRTGARLKQPPSPDNLSPETLHVELSGDLVVEPGGAIDVTGLGYPPDVTYPGELAPGSDSGGSHIGYGGRFGSNVQASTYGSIYRPQENGGGGNALCCGGRGGGTVRLIARNVTLLGATSAIRANGADGSGSFRRGGAGGSVWITASGTVSGDGVIEARGGSSGNTRGSGGGGAIAVEYQASGGTVFGHLRSWGGATSQFGGAGSVYLFGPASTWGDLIIDNGTIAGGVTRLPALGGGVAQAGSAGAVLATGAAAVPAYFIGHWVEVRDGATGELEGTWRVARIDGATLTLASAFGEPVTVDPGDRWQGVYRFDNYSVRGDFPVESPDPVRVGGVQEIAGDVQVRQVVAHDLVIRAGATLTHPATADPNDPESLSIELTGDLVLEGDATIDVSARGFAPDVTYPGEIAPGSDSGGSHIGYGGRFGSNVQASTFGSIYRPRENGGGGNASCCGGRGGGTVRVVAKSLVLDAASSILANGADGSGSFRRGGAGGSVWITVDAISGDGAIEARGGSSLNSRGSGGGGAVAVEYGSALGTVLDHLRAYGGSAPMVGGAGSVYLFGPTARYGDLVLANGGAAGGSTELPSLGSGIAQAGSGGGVLVTDRAVPVPAYFVGHWVELTDAATGELKGTWRVKAIDGVTVTLASNQGEPISVVAGDLWQGVYLLDNYTVSGDFPVESRDPIRVGGTQEITGNVELREIRATNLVIRSGASITHPATVDPSAPESLRIELTGDLVLEPGATIDVSGRGFASDVTYPGETPPGSDSGGSHLGAGGLFSGPRASTYGSVYFPRENGGGGQAGCCGGRGGGTVRITAANVTLTDATSTIRANGLDGAGSFRRGGAGGSVWITVFGAISGDGVIEARGGSSLNDRGSGGGGAITVEYSTSSGSALDNLVAWGGGANHQGGAGTVYLRHPSSTYGDLTIDNGTVVNGWTILPALGGGTALQGSGGGVLVTDRASIRAYFTGHWVEVYDAAGALKGTWRISAIAEHVITLAPNGSGTATVVAGDTWQGVYRFDNFEVLGDQRLESEDPIRVTGQQTIVGSLTTRRITSRHLTLTAGARLTHPTTASPAAAESLRIELSGDLVLEAGAEVDVTGQGYATDTTYPGETPPGSDGGGSHLGYGGRFGTNPLASTYGSLYRPRENGGGGQAGCCGGRGGGTVRVVARSVTLTDTSAIRANGTDGSGSFRRGGAGGSVWITVSESLGGAGVVEARGGAGANGRGSGGGGAIALEYSTATGTVLDNLRAWGGDQNATGGAGTVYLKSSASTYGDLIVDTSTFAASQATRPPALGSGVAQPGTLGAVLATDRPLPIPPYFEGHWVEIRNAVTGTVQGTWRIARVIDGATVELAPNGAETIQLQAGDLWQGVYRFDSVSIRGTLPFASPDPFRIAGELGIDGEVETRELHGHDLRLAAGSRLHHPLTQGNAAEILRLELTGDLVLEPGASIDVTGLGYPPSTTYPGETPPGSDSGGSHLGYGGPFGTNTPGSTFGSVYRPQEDGGGGQATGGARGGGAVRIVARSVTLADATSTILANGVNGSGSFRRGGAGGSVWISATAAVAGDGVIEARGAPSTNGRGSGGGGAIAVEYGSTAGSILSNLRAPGGDQGVAGGAGTVYLLGAAATHGDLVVDNASVGGAATELPALGGGAALAGTSGAVLVTDRGADAPAYFVGHWVEIAAGDGTPKGIFRVASVSGVAATLDLAGSPISLAPGDLWQGVYRFDTVTVAGGAVLTSVDPVLENDVELDLATKELAAANDDAPWIDARAVTVTHDEVPGAYRVEVPAAAVGDADGVSEVRLGDGVSRTGAEWLPGVGAVLTWLGLPGRALTLTVIDDHPLLRRGSQVRLSALPDGGRSLPAAALPRPGERQPSVATGNGWTIAAYERRLALVDAAGAAVVLPLAAGDAVVDVAADETAAVVLVASANEAGETDLHLVEVPLAGAPALSEKSRFAIPADVFPRWRIELAPGAVRLIGSGAADGTPDALLVFPDTYPGEALAASPEIRRR